MTNILTVQPCFNPFFIEDRQIKKIHFFNESGVVLSTRSGWFGSTNNFRGGLDIPETISKRKIDFSIKKCFYVWVKGEYYEKGKYAELYLYIDGEQIKLIDRYESTQKIGATDIWTYDNITVEICGHVINENLVKKIEKNNFGKRVEALEKELKEEGIKIDSYNLEILMKKYDLIKKGGKND